MTRFLRRVLAFAAPIGFVLSLIVHASALLGIDVAARFNDVWLLHLGVILVFLPYALWVRRDQRRGDTQSPWVVTIGALICCYVLVTFFIVLWNTEGGSAAVHDGKYLLLNHGNFIRELAPAEYTSHRTNFMRGISGLWLMFFYFPMTYFFGSKSNNSFKGMPLRGTP